MQPLDPLGQALASYREAARHDIDWRGHPLMRVYEAAQHGRLAVCQPSKRRHIASRARRS